ncbi:MAG: adenosylcobinamide-phosphate synthase CbiB [Nitrospirota bacterium]|nr:adenosylcobinamide-phosphate synthase CbiB [Nitrospirota bacterium]
MESLNIISAYLLDLALGDPRGLPHPVKIMGKLINFLEGKLRNGKHWKILRIKGAILALAVVGISASCAYLILDLMRKINPIAVYVAWIFLAYTTLATKDLFLHAKKVLKGLEAKDIIEARNKLSCIVGRDTQNLSEDGVVKAAVESIAENTNDGIVAPLFYLILGGPVLAVAYKAINTLDSMVGYKNEKYRDFGWFSARLDDVANYIPARISGFLISISSFILGKGFKDSFKTMLIDGKNHPSPNSGISEAAMAGALGIRLGGGAFYQGKFVEKQYIGEDRRKVDASLINETLKISFLTSVLMLILGVLFKWLI